jgi:hypothetical protein
MNSLPSQLRFDINQFKLEGFAKKYFMTHKRGIFRRRVPVEKMLLWTKVELGVGKLAAIAGLLIFYVGFAKSAADGFEQVRAQRCPEVLQIYPFYVEKSLRVASIFL